MVNDAALVVTGFRPGVREKDEDALDAGVRQGREQQPGVVGEEPTLKAGESFEYTSGVPLPTPSGFMVGSYGMLTEAGENFDIEIPAFSLDSTYAERTIN